MGQQGMPSAFSGQPDSGSAVDSCDYLSACKACTDCFWICFYPIPVFDCGMWHCQHCTIKLVVLRNFGWNGFSGIPNVIHYCSGLLYPGGMARRIK